MERLDPEGRHSPLSKDPLPQMNIWRVWHPDYGVIYDEIAEVKKGKYEWKDKEATSPTPKFRCLLIKVRLK